MQVFDVEIKNGTEVFIYYETRGLVNGRPEEVSWPISWAEENGLPANANVAAVKQWAARQWLTVLQNRKDLAGIAYDEPEARQAMIAKGITP